MSEERELKKGNNQNLEEETEAVEGYSYCSTNKQKCLHDCPPANSSPFLSDLN